MLIPTRAFWSAMLAALFQHVVAGNYSGPLYGAYVMLFTNTPQLSPDSVLADLTETVYTGYARQAVGAVQAAYIGASGNPTQNAPLLQFQPTGTAVGEVIMGVALVSAAINGTLLAAEMLPDPLPMRKTTDNITVLVQLELDATNGIGTAEILD